MTIWMIIGGIIVLFLLMKGGSLMGPKDGNLDAAQAKAWMAEEKALQVIDVRSANEHRQGHLPGAKLIPLGELGSRLSELDASKPVLIHCAFQSLRSIRPVSQQARSVDSVG